MPFRETAFVLDLSLAVCAAGAQASQWIRTLHCFYGLDGQDPSAPLVLDNHGNLYGTTCFGGDDLKNLGAGTVFEIGAE